MIRFSASVARQGEGNKPHFVFNTESQSLGIVRSSAGIVLRPDNLGAAGKNQHPR